ncbi:hypothetical protein Sjap_002439 [Stephania japonica]|uniref:Uncharacterized protein n=1 Tax=Stephania japonica TaxID=461633 RepID=A0AAP0PUJ2_9MAGN
MQKRNHYKASKQCYGHTDCGVITSLNLRAGDYILAVRINESLNLAKSNWYLIGLVKSNSYCSQINMFELNFVL